jgi:plastocyanin
MKKIIAVISIVIGLALVASFFWWINSEENLEDEAVFGTVITYRDSGFSPPVLRAASGSEVTIENQSSADLEFVSDPHPTHTDNPQLNTNVIGPSQSAAIIVTSKGTWSYHNHLDPGHGGKIIID